MILSIHQDTFQAAPYDGNQIYQKYKENVAAITCTLLTTMQLCEENTLIHHAHNRNSALRGDNGNWFIYHFNTYGINAKYSTRKPSKAGSHKTDIMKPGLTLFFFFDSQEFSASLLPEKQNFHRNVAKNLCTKTNQSSHC